MNHSSQTTATERCGSTVVTGNGSLHREEAFSFIIPEFSQLSRAPDGFECGIHERIQVRHSLARLSVDVCALEGEQHREEPRSDRKRTSQNSHKLPERPRATRQHLDAQSPSSSTRSECVRRDQRSWTERADRPRALKEQFARASPNFSKNSLKVRGKV